MHSQSRPHRRLINPNKTHHQGKTLRFHRRTCYHDITATPVGGQKATAAITDMADRDSASERPASSRSRRSDNSRGIASVSRGLPSSPSTSPADSNQHIHLSIKMPSNKLRQAAAGDSRRNFSGSSAAVNRRDQFDGGEIVTGKRTTRGGRRAMSSTVRARRRRKTPSSPVAPPHRMTTMLMRMRKVRRMTTWSWATTTPKVRTSRRRRHGCRRRGRGGRHR